MTDRSADAHRPVDASAPAEPSDRADATTGTSTGTGPLAGDPIAPESTPAPDSAAARRAFLNDMSREAVSTAGRVVGFSAMLRRSVFAAGEAAAESLSGVGREEPEPVPAPLGEAVAERPPEAVPAASSSQGPMNSAPVAAVPAGRDPVASLTTDQHAYLSGMARAALAVNDPAGSPHVTSSAYHWDGSVIRLPGQQFTLRVSNIERDSRVSVLIEDPSSGSSVAISAIATAVYGDRAEAGMLLILGRDLDDDAASVQWEELNASGDRMVIEVRPTRFVWRTG